MLRRLEVFGEIEIAMRRNRSVGEIVETHLPGRTGLRQQTQLGRRCRGLDIGEWTPGVVVGRGAAIDRQRNELRFLNGIGRCRHNEFCP